MRGHVRMRLSAVLGALIALAVLPAHAQPSAPATPTVTIPFAGLSQQLEEAQAELAEASARAFELQRQIESLEADSRALAERLAVTAERVRTQRTEVEAAEIRLAASVKLYELGRLSS